MFNSAKCSFVRELGRPFRKGFYDAIAEDALTDSTLIPKALPLPAATKTTFFMATSPDGKLIATAHGDHCVYVCDILHGRVIHRLAGHPRSPWALAFHPSRSDLLASGCLGGEVRVWDLKTGCSESLHLDNEDAMVPGTSSNAEGPTVYTASVAIASVAFHPDERLLAIAAGDRLIFWDWSSKYPRAECRTATPRERVRYVKFDRTGMLYTGITNSRQVITTTIGTDAEPPRPAMASTPPEVMPHRCRELLTSRNEILQMRAELSRRHEQLLQRYNDLLRRYEELRERYPDIRPSNNASPIQGTRPILPPPPSPPPPPPAAPRRWLDEADGSHRFVSLMEENRRVGLEEMWAQASRNAAGAGAGVEDTERNLSQPDAPMSPIQLERLDEPETYAREVARSSLQHFERRHNLSYDRLCRSYRTLSESAQRLVMEFQRVYSEYVTMKEEVRRRTGTLEPSRGAQYETGRAVLSTLAQMQVIMLSGDVPPTSDVVFGPLAGGDQPQQGRVGQWSEERRMYERVQREARTLTRVHDLLLELRNRLDFQADVVEDLRRGRDRLDRLITELEQAGPGAHLEVLHQRLVTEIRHFKLFIRQWKQVVMSNLSTMTSSGRPPGETSTATTSSSGGGNSFVRLSLSPEARDDRTNDDGPSTSAESGNQEGSASGTATISKRVANVLVSPLRKRPAGAEGENSSTSERRTTEPMTTIRLPPPVVNLSPSRTVETHGASGGTTYHYSYPYSPPHRSQAAAATDTGAAASGSSSQTSDNAVPIKRRRLNFGQAGETSASSASSNTSNTSQTESSSERPDLNRAYLPLPGFGSSSATSASSASSSGSASGIGQSTIASQTQPLVPQRHGRPNIVLFVPRESSRLSSANSNSSNGAQNQATDRSASSSLSELSARARRYVMVGSPPRFERVTRFPTLGSMMMRQPDPGQQQFTGIRDRGNVRNQGNQANGNPGDNNNNDDEWEYSYDLNRAVNRAIAGAFIGAGDMALANNILDMTCRIQRWTSTIGTGKYPDLTQSESNVVVSKCKLHNDGSVSINESGTLLAAFVENSAPDRTLWAHTTLKIVSLRPDDRGTVLYEKTFGPNAISVSFSPADGRHILIGLASRRYLRLRHSPQTCAMIFSLRDIQGRGIGGGGERRGPGELKLAMNVEHEQRPNGPLFGGGVVGPSDEASNLLTWGFRVDSLNCSTWLPTPGQGVCYGTNRGQVFILTPKREETDETDESEKSLAASMGSSTAPFQRQLARWNVYNNQNDSAEGELLSGNGNLMM